MNVPVGERTNDRTHNIAFCCRSLSYRLLMSYIAANRMNRVDRDDVNCNSTSAASVVILLWTKKIVNIKN